MTTPLIWELDFYSRPVLDENDKKIWELLVCNPDRSFYHVQPCPSQEVNSGWLSNQLLSILSSTKPPLKVRFFRSSMTNIITRGCKQAGLVPQATRRLFAMADWLQERMVEVYPKNSKFQAPDPDPLPLKPAGAIVPQALPDALTADRWQILSLPSIELKDAREWGIDFGEFFPVNLAPDTEIPGIMMVSPRAMAISAWMSGVEPVFLRFYPLSDRWQLRLDCGADASWIVADITDGTTANAFEEAKLQAGGIHFLSLKTDPETEKISGFWLLKQLN